MLGQLALLAALGATPPPASALAVPFRAGVEADALSRARALEERSAEHPRDPSARVDLALAYRALARLTGRAEWDVKAAIAVSSALALAPADPDALAVKAWVQAANHDFENAVLTAASVVKVAPRKAWAWGVLADGYVELGRYPEAVAAVEKMMANKPGGAAYSRAAHLRSLHGDSEGAVALMQMAVDATSPSDPEGRAWMLVMLGREHQSRGEHDVARINYRAALRIVPDYHLAVFHLADSLAAGGEIEPAIALLAPLHSAVPGAVTAAALGDLHAEAGRSGQAAAYYAEVDAFAATRDPAKAEPRWLAKFYADQRRELADAVSLVQSELKTHQDVETWDGLAWALHRSGRHAEAMTAAERASAIGTRRARLLYHRGLIEQAAGRNGAARRSLEAALTLNDLWPAERREAAEALKRMTTNGGDR